MIIDKDNLPEYFYKYGSMQKPEYLKEVLLENKIWFQSPLKFNDPFDCRPRIVTWGSRQDNLKLIRAAIKKRFPGKERNELRIEARRVYNTLKNMDDLMETYELVLGRAGVYSLSEKKENLLMWAHYANYHRGYCLIFSNRLKDPLSDNPAQVRYQAEYPIVRFSFKQSKEERGIASFLIKSSDWEYEKEWRLLARFEGHYSFEPDVLVGLIMGCKTNEKDRRVITGWIAQRSIPLELWKAEMHKDQFALEFVKLN